MPFVTRKSLLTLSILSGVAVVAVAGFVYSGIYNVGADDQHTRPVHALMESLRERSIEVRASKLTLPDLGEQARIVQGSGNYNAMCMGCHLAPGMAATELSKGLYPAPPELTKEAVDPAEAFWVIKHGIKASGMPAWGKSMDDEYIWNMAAFLQRLPGLDGAAYAALVASSDGHSHGGGESTPHDHGPAPSAPGHAHAPGTPAHHDAPSASGHAHAPGTPAHHDAPSASSHAHAPGTPAHHDAPADGGHAHAPGTPAHDDPPAHVDPPGTPPHSH